MQHGWRGGEATDVAAWPPLAAGGATELAIRVARLEQVEPPSLHSPLVLVTRATLVLPL